MSQSPPTPSADESVRLPIATKVAWGTGGILAIGLTLLLPISEKRAREIRRQLDERNNLSSAIS